MTDQIVYLNVPKRRTPVTPEPSPAVYVGRQYKLAGAYLPADLHGICAGFLCSSSAGEVIPLQNNEADSHCYLWDADSDLGASDASLVTSEGEHIVINAKTNMLANRFVLSNATLGQPEIQEQNRVHQLSVRAGFDFVYTADKLPARLGILSLVESTCFVMLKNGAKQSLLDTGEEQAVLFLNQEDKHEVMTPIMDVARSDDSIQKSYEESITHIIPEQLDGIEIETMTVLEQYKTFFMQREQPFTRENIWTPVCAPISWGWSIRLVKRYDGDWSIARQKLLTPAVGHNGLEMPIWKGNHLRV
jgi:hypothetical protein